MDNRPIGVFDSGVGGLTAVKELRRLLPAETIVYFGDTGRVPYGNRGRDTIIKYARQIIRFLLQKDVKMIVAACGTVSSTLPEEVIRDLPVDYTGVVGPACRAAAERSRSGKIAVIGTTATIKSGAYQAELARLLPGARVTAKDCPLLAPLVENGQIERDNPITRMAAEMYLKPIRDVDTLILGCTHYPVIYDLIADVAGAGVELVNSGLEVAKFVKAHLTERELLSDGKNGGGCSYYVTDAVENFWNTAQRYMKISVAGDVSYVDPETL